MKVLFDVTSLLPRQISFEGLYTQNLFRLLRGLGVEIDPVYKVPSGIKENYIEGHIGNTPKKFYGFFSAKDSILHGPTVGLLSENPKFKKVISVNDMAMFRDGFMDNKLATQLQTHMKEQLQKNPLAVFVPTYEVHNEFLARFPKFVNKVHVVSPGCDQFYDAASSGYGSVSDKPFFFFNGVIDKRSNLSGVVKAFHGFCELQPEIKLLVAGMDGYGADAIHKMIQTSSCANRIQVLGYKGGDQLKKLYSQAIATIIPSLYEGFSYPMVEAMKMGCPVLASAGGAMSEVGREGAHLVNPKDPEQIMAGMERLFVDKTYRGKLVEKGKDITEKMSWLNCARKVVEVYSKI
ncbi:MAG: glycosyltransferase family 1 protein [Pseudomonadota bacterium]